MYKEHAKIEADNEEKRMENERRQDERKRQKMKGIGGAGGNAEEA